MSDYHKPVLLNESVERLLTDSAGVYVDATFGGGGHSSAILQRLGPEAKLFGFDRDPDALRNVIEDSRFKLLTHNFRHLKRFLRLEGVREVDGILADLGVSSYQIDTEARGFSFRFQGDLDMRMDKQSEKTAATLLNRYSEQDLQEVFGRYGEVRNAKTLAKAVVEARAKAPIMTIQRFLDVIGPWVRGDRNRYLAQVFQALRIEVNEEMESLEDFLRDAMEVLKPGGRLVVISYHSLEDRLVKNFMKSGNAQGELLRDFYGNIHRPFKILTKKPILPSEEEIRMNPRARSAKMRVAERIKQQ